ncbi:MAG TPA: LysR family transcriptional regulator [Alphaproteobacteria bacterium]|jgi:DNA-binding transcriptional LysR family regulator
MIFVRVADRKSMAQAAKELGLSAPYVSKRIKFLEDELRTQLLIRSTHYLSLTDVGEKYYKRCSDILSQLTVADEEVADLTTGLRGSLRVYCPQGFGEHVLTPIVAEFGQLYPEIMVDLRIADQSTSPMEKGVDLTIRTAELIDSSLVCTEIGTLKYQVCASPEFLKKGVPKSPEDLADFNCLIHTVQTAAREWPFRDGKKISTIIVDGNLHSSSGVVIYRACKHGAGIARLPEYDATRGVRGGYLKVLFPDQLTFTRTLRAYYPRTPHVPIRLETFTNFLKARMRGMAVAGWP